MPILSILARPVPDVATPPVLGEQLPVTLADGRTVDHVNLDYAATAPCLASAATAVSELLPWYASVHRGAGAASRRCTYAYEQARETISDFISARPDDHVIFTRNTTDALNLLARAIPAGTTVIGWAGEHHANLLPWADTVRLPIPTSTDDAKRALTDALAAHRSSTAAGPAGAWGPVLIAVTAASNVTGELWPVDALTDIAHRYGARIVIDAAQLAPHRPFSLTASGVDYVALSGHKLYAPFGIGVLAGRGDWLDAAQPYLAGGGATASVSDAAADVCWLTGPARHEAGTPNLLGAVALAAACAEIASYDRVTLARRECALLDRLRDGLDDIPGLAELRLFTGADDDDRVGIVSFAVDGVQASEVSEFLASRAGIGVRDGLFCAHPLTRHLLAEAAERTGLRLGPTAVRASIGLGTTVEHVDRLLATLRLLVSERHS